MKKHLLLLILFYNLTFSQTVSSPYLQAPELIIGYVDSCAKFWLNAYDSTYGGFFTNVDKQGNVISSWGLNKNLQTQTRDAYGFTRAYQLTGDTLYLQKAKQALSFMVNSAWDNSYGGWYSSIDRLGNPTNPGGNKNAFDQHYALLGLTAYFEATGDTSIKAWIDKSYINNEQKLWDNRENYLGYFDYANFNWTQKNGKSFNATVDALTTHLFSLYLLTGDLSYKEKAGKIVDNILDYFVASMSSQVIGFVEKYNSSWAWNNSETMTLMGHVLKTAWCLGRMHQLFPDTSLVSASKKLIEDVLLKGYDHTYGGPYKDYNRVTGEMLMWGNPDTAKAWWQMEQGVTAGLMLYDITGDAKYLEMADETLQFFMNYFVDPVYGEVYENRTRRGEETWGEHKGNGNKAAYHSIELGYYVYLYGKIFYKNEPAVLFYNYSPVDYEREISLTPIEINDDRLIIEAVKLNGAGYGNFNSLERKIILPPGTGGEFEVTFKPQGSTYAANNKLLPVELELFQNYPNPFNPVTNFRFRISNLEFVTLKIFDVLGNEVAVLVNEIKEPGVYNIKFNAGNEGLASGIYFYRLNTQSSKGNFSISKKMILLK